jgi:hypothetical protein
MRPEIEPFGHFLSQWEKAKPLMNLLKKIYRILSSLGLGVTLLAIIAAILAVATKFESNTSTHLVQAYIYRTGWFDFLLGLFGVNLTLATWNLRPFKLRHIGVITIHASLLIILVGAWMTRNLGFEGNMVISEGETADYITLRDMVLTVYSPENTALPLKVFPTLYQNSPPREFLKDHYELSETEILTVDRFYTDAQPFAEVRDDGSSENPALHFTFTSSMFDQDGWLFPRRERERTHSFGGLLQFESVEFPDLAAWNEALTIASPGTLKLKHGGRIFTLKPEAVGDTLEVNNGCSLVVERCFRNFSMGEDNSYRDLPGAADNPAIQFSVIRQGKADGYLFFGKMPAFDPLLGREAALTLVSEIEWQPAFSASDLAEKQVRIGLVGDGLQLAWYKDGELHQEPMTIGEAVTLPWMAFQLAVDKVYKRAWRAEDMRNVDVAGNGPAVRVRVGDGDLVTQKWLRLGERKPFKINGQNYLIAFEQQRVPVGFELKLVDFIEDRYPGSMMASGYASFVEMTDHRTGDVAVPIEISMNNTLVHGGFKFFQSSFRRPGTPGGVETTILSVNHDPGHVVVYLGSLTLVIGLFVVFFFKKKLIKLERRRA